MDEFILYSTLGFKHVLDLTAYDHLLFLIVLVVIFNFYQWKKVLWLITFFTIGHSISLGLAAYGVVNIRLDIVEFLIPITILITGIFNLINSNKSPEGKDKITLFFALFFGLIHGLGFSNYFRSMIGKEEDKFFPLVEFALGIEAAQIIIVFCILTIGMLLQSLLKVSRKDWILVTSAIVIWEVIPMIYNRIFW
ncbi:MAG: Uncharacterised protein [Flavobacterium sp. SCGC AAA160-P02]|nr:MAG: Uncharacterised protein [Flavobacterium sp. SCGC AAA160-P02]